MSGIDGAWDRPEPFVLSVRVAARHIDSYGHVNNVVYIGWLQDCAWAHSAAVGLDEAACVTLRRGMAVRTMHVDMLAAAYEGDALAVANWITAGDGRLRASRAFQIVREATGETLLRADIDYVCVNLDNGRPARMPSVFRERYRPDYPVPGSGRKSPARST